MSDYRKIGVGVFFLVLLAILVYAFFPYRAGVFGALILYVLLQRPYRVLSQKVGSAIALTLCYIGVFVVVLLPLVFLSSLAVSQIPAFTQSVGALSESTVLSQSYFGVTLAQVGAEISHRISIFLQQSLITVFHNSLKALMNILLLFVLLTFLLTKETRIKEYVLTLLPFNTKHSLMILKEFSTMTKATVVSSTIIALVQGTLLGLSFYLFGLPSPLIWGVIGVILSYIPVIGVPLVWVPATIILFVNGLYGFAIGMLIAGIIMSNIDNVIRPYINRRIGNIDPYISFIGVVFVGIPLFGIVGLIIGPLVMTYFFLIIKILKNEYA